MQNKKVQTFFDKESEIYFKHFYKNKSSKNFIFNKRKEIVLSQIKNNYGNILDIAAGSGEISSSIIDNNNFNEITLIDISKKMLNLAKIKINSRKNINFINDDFFNYEFKNKFDYVISLGILAHISNTDDFFKKISDFSKKDSKIVLQSSLEDFLTNKINKIFFSKRYFKKNDYRINFIKEGELKNYFKKYGFEIIFEQKYSLSIPILDNYIPTFNFYIEKIFEKIFPNKGSEVIYILKKK